MICNQSNGVLASLHSVKIKEDILLILIRQLGEQILLYSRVDRFSSFVTIIVYRVSSRAGGAGQILMASAPAPEQGF